MIELLELRVQHRFAHLVFAADEGERLGPLGHVRRIVIPSDDPRLPRIIAVQKQLRASEEGYLVGGWNFVRKYSKAELQHAELLAVDITAVFEPAGEECGTVYDVSDACPVCGAGRVQKTELRLKLSRAPKKADIAMTIARDEYIVSARLAALLEAGQYTGFELRPIVSGKPPKEAISPDWKQLHVTGTLIDFAPHTRFGESPVDPENRYACPTGDTAGHALVSRPYVDRPQGPMSDWAQSRQFIGTQIGLIVPRRQLFVSGRLYGEMRKAKVKGLAATVAEFGGR